MRRALERAAGWARALRAALADGPRALAADRRGTVVLILAFVLPTLGIAASAAVEYANLARMRARLQRAVDAGAMEATRQLMLANVSDQGVATTAREIVLANLRGTSTAGVRTDAQVLDKRRSVRVDAVLAVTGLMGHLLSLPSGSVEAQAKATLSGQTKLCVLALDPLSPNAIDMRKTAQLTAADCSVYSDSFSPLGVAVMDSAKVTATGICSVGGYVGLGASSLSPAPTTGCPTLADPLAGRAAPGVAGCDYTNKVVYTGTAPLNPGVYCNGLKITGGAVANLAAGTYVISGAPLTVDGGATLQGDGVGFYLSGQQTTVAFAKDSTISLSAPKTGAMAGLLFFEDRAAPLLREHRITSDNARRLLGTIYLPRGALRIDAVKPVADQSAYTVIVARQLRLDQGPNLVMNAMYADSDVPVPEGVGSRGGRIALTQ